LAGVWDLADTQNRGQLSQNEFAIAMHLIRRVRGGSPLPTTLPASMLSHFQSKNKGKNTKNRRLPQNLQPTNPLTLLIFFVGYIEALTARVNHLQETIAKEQEDLPEIQQAAKDQENVVSDLQKQVDALEQSLQQVVQQKSDLQATLDTLKKSEHDKRRKITLLEKEYNTTQTELVSLKAAHQQQLALAGVSTSQLVAAQSLKDKSAQELALAQSGQFDKISGNVLSWLPGDPLY
jgi:chromosome segregation ATPase